MSSLNLLKISKKSLVIHPSNDGPVDDDVVYDLTQIMDEKGFDKNYPLHVVEGENSTYQVLSGKHRLAAAKESDNVEYIYAIDKTNEDPLENALEVVRSNTSHPQNMLEVAKNYKWICDNLGKMKQTDYAKRIGKSDAYVSIALKALGLYENPKIGDRAEGLTPGMLSSIARLPEDKQIDMVDKALSNDWNLSRINDEVSRIKNIEDYQDSTFTEPETEKEPQKELAFIVPLSLVENVSNAIDKMKKEIDTKSSGIALSYICGNYLANGEIINGD